MDLSRTPARRWLSPVTWGFALLAAASSLTYGGDHAVNAWASTNLANMGDHPVEALITSAFLFGADPWACLRSIALAGAILAFSRHPVRQHAGGRADRGRPSPRHTGERRAAGSTDRGGPSRPGAAYDAGRRPLLRDRLGPGRCGGSGSQAVAPMDRARRARGARTAHHEWPDHAGGHSRRPRDSTVHRDAAGMGSAVVRRSPPLPAPTDVTRSAASDRGAYQWSGIVNLSWWPWGWDDRRVC